MQDDQAAKTKNTGIFSLFTSFSRILGLARDMLKAYAFGTGIFAVAFDIAFRLPNMLRNLAAEGALSHAFVPLYEEHRGTDQERNFSGTILAFLLFFLTLLCVIAFFAIPYLIPYLLHDPNLEKSVTTITINLSQILFPYILFISLSSIYMGIQYTHNVFWAASFGPALLNIVSILSFGVYLVWFKINQQNPDSEQAVYVFAYTALLGAIIQLFFQSYQVRKLKVAPRYRLTIRSPYIRQLLFLMLPAIFSAAVQEIGQLIDILMATAITEIDGAVAALTYAHRVMQLPMGIFGVAIATATLPQLSRFVKENNWVKYSASLTHSINLNFFLLLPATLGLLFFSKDIVGLLLEYGKFDKRSTEITASAIQYYSIGILAFSLQKLFLTAWYSQKKSKIPAIITILSLLVNILLSLILMQTMYHNGLALASSLSGYLGVLIYLILLWRDKKIQFHKVFIKDLVKIILLNCFFFLFLYLGNYFMEIFLRLETYSSRLLLGLPSAVVFYIGLAVLFKNKEIKEFSAILLRLRRSK